MERHRQITQSIDHAAQYRGPVVFLLDGTVASLETVSETVEERLPSRVKGVPRIIELEQERYVTPSRYKTLDSLIEAERIPVTWRSRQGGGWELKHIPGDVLKVCSEWEEVSNYPSEKELAFAAKDISLERDSRLSATCACPHCPADTRYACRLSGWSRELYRYPLIEAEDAADGQKYEVPFDIALYITTTNNTVEYQVNHEINEYDGKLSARRSVSIKPATLSREYVIAATDGRYVPVSDELTFQNKKPLEQVSLKLDHWYEEPSKHRGSEGMPIYTAAEMIEAFQDEIMLSYAERAEEMDYNALFARVQQEFGKRGLGLVFGTEYCGMGDSQMVMGAYNSKKRTKRDVLAGMDSSELIKNMCQKLDQKNAREE